MHFSLKSIIALIVAVPAALAYIDQPCDVEHWGRGVCVKKSDCVLVGKQSGIATTYSGYSGHWPCPEDPDDVVCCYKETSILRNGSRLQKTGTCKHITECPTNSNTRIPSAECPGSQNVQLCVPKAGPVKFTTKNVIDISQFNVVTNYNSAASSSDVDGVIMRVGGTGWGSGSIYADTAFENHYTGFKNTGKVKIGYYFFSQAITEQEAINEAQYVINKIKGKRCDFPIYWDSEIGDVDYQTGRADHLSKAQRTKVGLAFVNHIKSKGYKAGVYASESWYYNNIDYQQFINAGASIWVAKWSSYQPSQSKYDVWQYSNVGSISGINGNVDKSRVYNNIAGW